MSQSIMQNIQWNKPAEPDSQAAPDMSQFDGRKMNDLRARIIAEDPNVTLEEMRKGVQFIFNLRGKVAADADAKKKAEAAAKKINTKEKKTKDLAAKGNELLDDLLGNLGD